MNRLITFIDTIDSIPEKTILVFILGLVLLVSHSMNFKFLINRSSIFLTLMLPVSIMIVTQTISTNLYLSLGLIGALSIVRYRTPVKSQYELAYLFVLIAIGIVGGVLPSVAVFMTIVMSLLPFLYNIFIKFFPSIDNENLRFYSDGKVEMNLLCSINNEIPDFKNTKKGRILRIDYNYKNKEVFYLINFESMNDANEYQKSLKIRPKSISISNS